MVQLFHRKRSSAKRLLEERRYQGGVWYVGGALLAIVTSLNGRVARLALTTAQYGAEGLAPNLNVMR